MSVRYYDWIAHFGRRTPDKIAAIDLASHPARMCLLSEHFLLRPPRKCEAIRQISRGTRTGLGIRESFFTGAGAARLCAAAL